MNKLFLLPAVIAGASAVAQSLPPEKRSCIQTPATTPSCFDAAAQRKGPNPFLNLCMQELAAAVDELDRYEACVAEALQKRQEEERKDLATAMAQRRASLLRNLAIAVR